MVYNLEVANFFDISKFAPFDLNQTKNGRARLGFERHFLSSLFLCMKPYKYQSTKLQYLLFEKWLKEFLYEVYFLSKFTIIASQNS